MTENPDSGIIRVVWGAGEINCYNLYIDGTRVRTKVTAQEFRIPVSTEGDHTVSVATVDANGKITAVGPGTCYIYILSNNGKLKSVSVTVE